MRVSASCKITLARGGKACILKATGRHALLLMELRMEVRVLQIDRDPDAIRRLRIRIGAPPGDNYIVELVTTPADAISRLGSKEFDVVVTELEQGDARGAERLHSILGNDARVPVVVWSTVDDPAVGLAAIRAGAQDYVAKSDAYVDLARTLRHAVERHRRQRALELEAIETAIDATVRKESEAARQAAQSVLEAQRAKAVFAERLRSLGHMAAEMAHELNQPLLGVRGLAEHMSLAIQRGWELPASEILEKTNLIIEQADRMSLVIEHTRSFVGDVRSEQVEPVDLNEVVRSARSAVASQFMDRRVRIELALAPSLPLVQVNPFSLEQALIDLLANARDAYEDGNATLASNVVVRTSVQQGEAAKVVRVQVADRGKGIPEHLRAKVFEPFFTTKAPDKSTGLGLSIARTLVETYGGSITIESNHATGTEVTMTFPVRDA